MDFKKLDVTEKANEGAWLTLCDPDGEELDARVKLVGQDSKVFKRQMHRLADLQRKKAKGLKAAELETHMLDTYVACTVELEGVFVEKKEIKADNPEDIREFYDNFRWVLDQVSEFVGGRTNFLPS